MPTGIYVKKLIPIAQRLARRTLKTDSCWLWTGSRQPFGHGQIALGGYGREGKKLLSTHRVAWELTNGQIPYGLCVLHKCDVPNCVNPDHLFLGTKADNTNDMRSKGRMSVGEMLPQTKLTESDVLFIRSSPDTTLYLAKQYNVAFATIHNIRLRNSWKHVP
jgi:hypothetical protein